MKRAKTNSAINSTLNGTEQLVLEQIRTPPGVSANELIQRTNKSIRTIRRVVKRLIDKGLVEYRGAKKTGGYYLND